MQKKGGFILIGMLVIMVFSGCTDSPTGFNIGGMAPPVIIARGAYTNLILDFKMSVGTIDIKVNHSAQYLAEITNRVLVRRGTDAEFVDAEEVEYSRVEYSEMDSKTLKAQFNSDDKGKQVRFGYEISITISNNISLIIDFDCGLSSEGVDFSSSFGSQSIFGDISDETITITSLDISVSTGDIYFDIGSVRFSDPFPSIETSTGNLISHINSVNVTKPTSWDISTFVGNINLYFYGFYSSYNMSDWTHTFNIGSSTGDIDVLLSHFTTSEIKVVVKSDISSKIIMPDFLELTASSSSTSTYSSTSITSPYVYYDFFLTTSTANVTVRTVS